MSKKVTFRVTRCILCPFNNINVGKDCLDLYWCEKYERDVSEEDVEHFPRWCNLENIEILTFLDGTEIEENLPDLEELLNKKYN